MSILQKLDYSVISFSAYKFPFSISEWTRYQKWQKVLINKKKSGS